MQKLFPVCFPAGLSASALQLDHSRTLLDGLRRLGFKEPRPVIVLVGGASGLQPHHVKRLRSLFANVLIPIAEASQAVVVDGGTDAGIMRLIGQLRAAARANFPLIGVLPAELALLPNSLPLGADAAQLERHHTHFVLVPGRQWGDESAWLADVASVIAAGASSLTLVVNGGEVTWKDTLESVRVGRPIVAVGGSGRAADVLMAAVQGRVMDERARKILASGLLQTVSLEQEEALATSTLALLLGSPSKPRSAQTIP